PVHGRNTTINVDKIRGFRPPYVWTKPFVFFRTIAHERMERCFLYACYGNPVYHLIRGNVGSSCDTVARMRTCGGSVDAERAPLCLIKDLQEERAMLWVLWHHAPFQHEHAHTCAKTYSTSCLVVCQQYRHYGAADRTCGNSGKSIQT